MVEEIAFAAVGLVRKACLEDLLILRSERGFLSLPPGLGLVVRRLAACREATIGLKYGARGKPARPRAFPVRVLCIVGGVHRADHHRRGGRRNHDRACRASQRHGYPPVPSIRYSAQWGAEIAQHRQYIPVSLCRERATNREDHMAGVCCVVHQSGRDLKRRFAAMTPLRGRALWLINRTGLC